MISKLSAGGHELFMTFTILLLLYDYDLSSMHPSLPELQLSMNFVI
jgi:hypothetical protein